MLFRSPFYLSAGLLRIGIADFRESTELLKRNEEKTNQIIKNELARIELLKKEENRLKDLIDYYRK